MVLHIANCFLSSSTAFSGSLVVTYVLAKNNAASILLGSSSQISLRVGMARMGDLTASARAFKSNNAPSLDLLASPRRAISIALPGCPCLSIISPSINHALLNSGWLSVIFWRIRRAFSIAGAEPSAINELASRNCNSVSSGFDAKALSMISLASLIHSARSDDKSNEAVRFWSSMSLESKDRAFRISAAASSSRPVER